MKCVECSCKIMADQARRKLPPAERAQVRSHRGRGLCSRCYSVARKAGTLLDVERTTVDRDTFLEDAHMLVIEQGFDRASTIAERLNMSKDAVTKALLRGARAGDERAIVVRSRLAWLQAAA